LKDVKLEYYPYKQIQKITEKFLKDNDFLNEIPIEVEELIEFKLGIKINFISNLVKTFEVSGYTEKSMERIWVDEYLFKNLEESLRFTLAHELGHIVLHKKIFENIEFQDSRDWKKYIFSHNNGEYELLERQADDFAGLLLVPEKFLRPLFDEVIHKHSQSFVKKFFPLIKEKGLNRFEFVRIFQDYIGKKLSPVFNVNYRVISIRIWKGKLDSELASFYPR
jgi:Zn-dependent peptidase ImmA (M78 family)